VETSEGWLASEILADKEVIKRIEEHGAGSYRLDDSAPIECPTLIGIQVTSTTDLKETTWHGISRWWTNAPSCA
jgi:hypothetical protein